MAPNDLSPDNTQKLTKLFPFGYKVIVIATHLKPQYRDLKLLQMSVVNFDAP